MDDEKDKLFQPPQGDPEEVKVVQDIFDMPVQESGGDNVFEQDLFGAPPPPPAPEATPVAPPEQPPPAEPEPNISSEPEPAIPSPPLETPPAEADSDVKVVGFDDFDKLESSEGLSVEGTSFPPGTHTEPTDKEEDEDMPEIISTGPPPQAAPSEEAPAPAEPESPTVETAEDVEDAEPAAVDEDIPIQPAANPIVFKAAKAKEGPKAVQQTQDFIEHLDGMDKGFLDSADIERAVQIIDNLQEEIRKLTERVEALEARLK